MTVSVPPAIAVTCITSAAWPVTEGKLGSACIDTQVLPSLTLGPLEQRVIELTVKPKQEGQMSVLGLHATLAGEVKGVEVELQARPTTNWSFNFGGGYIDRKSVV